MIASHRESVTSSGFSTITCFPAFAAATAGSMCAPLGVPIVTVSRTIGAIAMEGNRANTMNNEALLFTRAVLAQAGIALENARLVELLSSGKREWEQTVDAFNQAICYVDPQG